MPSFTYNYCDTVDINECSEGSHNCALIGGSCTNTVGSYNCSCVECYAGDGRSCVRIKCESLLSPSNGRINSSDTTCLATVAYGCNTGYLLNGDRVRRCEQDGSWSGDQPQCSGREKALTRVSMHRLWFANFRRRRVCGGHAQLRF